MFRVRYQLCYFSKHFFLFALLPKLYFLFGPFQCTFVFHFRTILLPNHQCKFEFPVFAFYLHHFSANSFFPSLTFFYEKVRIMKIRTISLFSVLGKILCKRRGSRICLKKVLCCDIVICWCENLKKIILISKTRFWCKMND